MATLSKSPTIFLDYLGENSEGGEASVRLGIRTDLDTGFDDISGEDCHPQGDSPQATAYHQPYWAWGGGGGGSNT